MIALNDNYCVLSSKFFNQEQLKELKEFLKVKLIDATINNSELIGSNMVLTNNGFVVSPRIKEKEFVLLEKELKLEGLTSTINYGDSFVGLGLIANSKTAFVGSRTSGIELMRIDEALSKR
jgi:translation initiation factor 6